MIAVDHEVNDTTSQADVLLPGVVHAETEGTFTDWEGRPTIYSGTALATNGRVHDAALALLRG